MLSFWFEFIYTTYGTVVPLEERKMITWNCFYFYFVWIYENFKGTIESLSSLIRLTNRNILHTWHHMQGCQSIFFFQCIRFFKYCLWMYRHTYIYTLFVDRFAVVVFIAFSAICMGRVSVSLRFFLFFGLTCVRISCDSFLNYCFVFSSFFLLFLLLF